MSGQSIKMQILLKILKSVTDVLIGCVPLLCSASDLKLQPEARWQLEFLDVPDMLATMGTSERQPARLTVRMPLATRPMAASRFSCS